MLLYGIVTVIILILDQGLKMWVINNPTLLAGGTVPLIPHVLTLTYLQNKGMAFGIGSGWPWFRWVVAAAALIFLFFIYSVNGCKYACVSYYAISACAASGMFLIQMALNIFGSTDLLPLTGAGVQRIHPAGG